VLVLGSEGEGLRRLVAEQCDHLARLEIDPRMESLNVSVAAGIALYLLARRAS
jgi:23S rRNA (guanosine2251-2'-O)-methyltransferase